MKCGNIDVLFACTVTVVMQTCLKMALVRLINSSNDNGNNGSGNGSVIWL